MKIDRMQSKLAAGEAFLIVSQANRKYFTDFDSSDGYLIITRSSSVFITDGRYIEAAQAKIKNCDEVIPLGKAKETLPSVIKKLGVNMIYTEAENLSVAALRSLRETLEVPVKAEKTDAAVSSLRREKAEYEKERIIKAQRIAEAAFEHILTFIKPGVTEKEIRLELEFFMLRNGADGLSFETIAISGRNTSMPHGVPTDKKIESGDFITMDYGALADGYHSDMTRTVAVGSVTDKMALVYNTVLGAQQACLDILAPGLPCADADKAARDYIENAGFGKYFTHTTGHGVGIDIHEAPTLSAVSTQILSCGDIVTDEPGIYIPGEFGVRIEDMVFITETGSENLTKCEKSLIIL